MNALNPEWMNFNSVKLKKMCDELWKSYEKTHDVNLLQSLNVIEQYRKCVSDRETVNERP